MRKTNRRGGAIRGLTITGHSGLFTFAIDADGHDWCTDLLEQPEDAEAAEWTHYPSVCDRCRGDRGDLRDLPIHDRAFPRPLGVPRD